MASEPGDIARRHAAKFGPQLDETWQRIIALAIQVAIDEATAETHAMYIETLVDRDHVQAERDRLREAIKKARDIRYARVSSLLDKWMSEPGDYDERMTRELQRALAKGGGDG